MYKLKHYNWDKFVSSICAGVDCIKTINGSLKGRGFNVFNNGSINLICNQMIIALTFHFVV